MTDHEKKKEAVDALTRLGGIATTSELSRTTTRRRLQRAVADGAIVREPS
jgi:hypothetical protein